MVNVTAHERKQNPIYTAEYARTDFRRHPERYRIGVGEQGVLLIQPYKSELLPLWRFRTPEMAQASARALERAFKRYRAANDLVGMDMARKFLQMGWTRSRRYANHRSGRKYIGAVPPEQRGRSGAHGRAVAPLQPDPVKAQSARIFRAALDRVLHDRVYQKALEHHRQRFEQPSTPAPTIV